MCVCVCVDIQSTVIRVCCTSMHQKLFREISPLDLLVILFRLDRHEKIFEIGQFFLFFVIFNVFEAEKVQLPTRKN